MDVVVILLLVLYALAIPLAVVLLRIAFAGESVPLPTGFRKEGWVDVGAEVTVEVAADEIVEYITRTGTGAMWVLGTTGVRVENDRLLPGEISGDIVRKGGATVVETHSDEPQPVISRIEVFDEGEKGSTVRWHARFQEEQSLRKVISVAVFLRPRLRKLMREQLERLPGLVKA